MSAPDFTQLLTQFVAPVAGLWAVHTAIIGSAKFVNEMRETVILGLYSKEKIKAKHREQIRLDWTLSMAATIGICIVFSGLLFAAAWGLTVDPFLRWSLTTIGLYSSGCALAFLCCAKGDYELMCMAVDEAFAEESHPK
jgi:hypothetical protein